MADFYAALRRQNGAAPLADFATALNRRRVAACYDRRAHTFFSAICIAAAVAFYLNQ